MSETDDDLTHLIEMNARALSKLDERVSSLTEREDRARRTLEKCQEERVQLEREHQALTLAEQVYRRTFGRPEDASIGNGQSDPDGAKPRARIGPQRYLMLACIRNNVGATPDFIAQNTQLSPRRVKEQMGSDVAGGIVKDTSGVYHLTFNGHQLMSRFEAYKDSRGEPLPSILDFADAVAENGIDETEEMIG